MISTHTSSVPKEDFVFPSLLYSDSRCCQAGRWRSKWLSLALPGMLRALPCAPLVVTGHPRFLEIFCPCSRVHLKVTASVPVAPGGQCIGPGNSGIWLPWNSGLTTLKYSQRQKYILLMCLLDLRFQVSSQDAPQCTPRHALKDAANCTRWHNTSLLDCTLSSKLSTHFQVYFQACSQRHFQLHLMMPPSLLDRSSQVGSQDTPKYTLKREDTLNPTWLYASMYAPACSIQRLGEWQMPVSGRREAGGDRPAVFGRWVAAGVWGVVCGKWPPVDIDQNHDIGYYHCLNLICSVGTTTWSHNAWRSCCSL